jgi:uncharacterized protein (DUF2141 family)
MVTLSMAQGEVVARLSNFRNDKGLCHICIYNNPASFKGEAGMPLACQSVVIKDGKAEVVFKNLKEGIYALLSFHDENKNNKMDRNFLGIPKEGYAASRNNLPFAAAPSFAGNQFILKDNSTVQLQMKIRNVY